MSAVYDINYKSQLMHMPVRISVSGSLITAICFGGTLPPNLPMPSLIAQSMAALMALTVSMSVLGMMMEQLYLGSPPLPADRTSIVNLIADTRIYTQ